MLSRILRTFQPAPTELLTSKLFDETTFYAALEKDLKKCQGELLIESPFITSRRLNHLMPTLQKLKERKVRVIINTRDPHEHEEPRRRDEAHRAVAKLQRVGIQVLYTGGHHRKLVVIDRNILYEGSLNVLSQNNSAEIMRRIESARLAWQTVRFIAVDEHL